MTQECVLVAGVDYPKYLWDKSRIGRKGIEVPLAVLGPGRWRDYCNRRADSILTRSPSTRVTIFDFYAGKVEQRLGAKAKWEPVPGIRPIGPIAPWSKNYRLVDGQDKNQPMRRPDSPGVFPDVRERHVLYFPGVQDLNGLPTVAQYIDVFYNQHRRPKESVLSIVDIYQYIDTIGAQRPGTLAELHVFSHAYLGGPILVNTIDLLNGGTQTPTRRDPYDKDGRLVDARDGAVLNVQLKRLKLAYAQAGRTYLWGCTKNMTARSLLRESKEKLLQLKNPLVFFTWLGDELWGDWALYQRMLHPVDGTSRSDGKSLSEVIKIVRRFVDESFAQQLANATGKPVYACPPGTGTDYDNVGPLSSRYLHVQMGNKKNNDEDDDRDILEMYRSLLGVQFDTSEGPSATYGRGLVIHMPMT